jgi:hypothetical protein
VQKSPNFRSDVENFAGVMPNLSVVEMSKWLFGSRITPCVDVNEILQHDRFIAKLI